MKKRILSFALALCFVFTLIPTAFADSAPTSGECGDNLTWELDSDGTLTISGTGEMKDYSWNDTKPWDKNPNKVLKVFIEDGVTSIGAYAFDGSNSLTNITIPSSVRTVGEGAFSSSSKIESVYYNGNIDSWLEISFASGFSNPCSNGGALYFNGELVTDVVIPSSVKTINLNAFNGCSSLKSITIPDSVTSLGEYAFYYCSGLTNAVIGNGIKAIGYSTFDGCSSLTDVTIGSSVTSIGEFAFYGCSSLTSVTIPGSVTKIGTFAFCGCSGLTSVVIGDGVKAIEYGAFSRCSSLTDIAFVGTKEAWASITKGTNAIPKSIRMHYDCPSLDNHIIAMERKDPSCTSTGYIKYSCSCGYEFTETLPEKHDYVFIESVVATCSNAGYDVYKCSKCGKILNKNNGEAQLPHEYELAEAVEPTCTEHGYDVYTCTMCGTSKTETRDDELLPHVYVATVTESTCLKGGYTTYTCSECGDSYVDSYTDALDHDYGEWTQTKAPTCTEQGTETRTCSRCSASETRDVDALGHTLVHHEGKAATCTEKGWAAYDTCNHCDYTTYKEIPATGHNYIAKVFAPTCTVKGYTTYTCSDCGDSYIDDYVDSLGHDRIHHEAKAATCTEIGWEAYDTCSRCDYTTYKEIPALGHDIVHHDAKAVTCTENGWAAFDTCSRCDYTTYEEIAAPGHSYQAKVFAPTCTVKGYTAYTCTVCGDSYKDNYTDALGHDRIHHEEKAATCAENGWEAFDTCSRCDYTTYEEIAALGHDYKNGSCTRCGADDPDYVEAPVIKITTSAGKPKISWNKVDGAAKYKVFYSTDGKKYYQLIETTKTSVTHTGAKIGTKYYYKIKAINADGAMSEFSNVKGIKCVPAAPTVTISRSGGKAKLSWKAVSGATKYWVYRSTDGKKFDYLTSTTKLTYTDSKAKSGTKYYYKVRAIAVVNNTNVGSAYSTAKSITTTLAKPTVKITTSNGKPKLSWSKVTGADRYYIYRSTDGKNFKYYTTTTKLTYTNTGAKKGTKYYYKVKAVCSSNTNANSALSTAVSIKATK